MANISDGESDASEENNLCTYIIGTYLVNKLITMDAKKMKMMEHFLMFVRRKKTFLKRDDATLNTVECHFVLTKHI